MKIKKYLSLLNDNKVTVLTVLLAFICGYITRQSIFNKVAPQAISPHSYPLREEGLPFKFIHPLLAYENPESTDPEYTPLKKDTQNLINDRVKTGDISTASVYFRDLTNSRWIGINVDETYSPASLLKISILIGYLKMSESGLVHLNDRYVYQAGPQIPFETPSGLTSGKSYTVNELLNSLITQSDNGAKDVLLSHIDQKVLSSVYDNLQLQDPDTNPDYVISAKNYALFLRVLYNATYLGRDTSEMALELLSQADFKDGLVAGVPTDVQVAHKFGEKVNQDTSGNVIGTEFHDCGIIYTKQGDYILCVMTKGPDKQKLINTIKDISELVYKDFQNFPKE